MHLPTFWPARVPNDVLTEEDFKVINSPRRSAEQKIRAFSPSRRKKWLRGYIYDDEGGFLGGSSIEGRLKGVTKFTKEWFKIGIVMKKSLDVPTELFPEDLWVETGRSVDKGRRSKTTQAKSTRRRIRSSEAEQVAQRPDWVDMNPRHLR